MLIYYGKAYVSLLEYKLCGCASASACSYCVLIFQSILIINTDWPLAFHGLNADQMTELFANKLFGIIKANIPNKILRLNDKDPPWITRQVKTAIKRKRRVFRKFMNSGRRLEDWQIFNTVRNETSRLVINAKDMYYRNLGRKLSDPSNGTKVVWSTMNRLIDQKKYINIPPLLENGLFVTNLEAKANILNESSYKCALRH